MPKPQPSLWALARRLREGDVTATQLAEAAIARHAQWGGPLNAFKLFLPEEARRAAHAADAAFAVGADLGPLHGLPVSIKDLFAQKDQPVFAGAPRELPARFRAEGPIVGVLRRQMAVITGRTHTTEFAYGEYGYGTNSHWGTPRNPWDATRHRPPGGSSSGAGISLWEGSSLLALGSDTTGSVREPAALSATVGLKVTHGRWSLDGIIPCSPSLDTPGPLARTVEDCAYGFAALDPAGDLPRLRAALDAATLAGLRIGIADDHYWQGGDGHVADIVRRALTELETGGARLAPFPLPEAKEAQTVFVGGDPCAAELHAFLAAELPEWIATLNPMLSPQVEAASRMTASDYLARWAKAARLARDFQARWCEADVIALPTQAKSPPDLEGLAAVPGQRWDAIEMRNTDWASLLGLCAISIPAGLDSSGLPVGLQLVAPARAEERLLAVAHACERRLGRARERLGAPPMTPD